MVLFVYMEVSCLKGITSSTKGRIIPLIDGSKVLCGRSENAHIRINSDMISRKHAELQQKEDGAWTIKDLQSVNGVFVNGIRLKPLEQIGLSDGDRVQLGVASGPDNDAEFVWIYYRNFRVKRRKTAKDNEATSCSSGTLSPVIAGNLTAGSDEASTSDSVSSLAFPLEAAPKAATEANSRIRNELQTLPLLSADRMENLESVLVSSALSCSVVKTENNDCHANSKPKDISSAIDKMKHEQLLQQREKHLAQMETELKEKEKRNKALEEELERKRQQLEKEIEMQQNLLKRDCEGKTEEADEVEQKLSSKRCRTEGETAAAAAELLCATKDDIYASQLRRDIGEVMESELQCSICSELLIKAVSINCSHSFCSYCLEKWMAVKRQCPICRAPVVSTVPVIAIDSYISRMVDENFSEDMKSKRQAMIKERQAAAIQHLPEIADFPRPINAIQRTEQRSIPRPQQTWMLAVFRRSGRPQPDFTEDRSQITRIRSSRRSTRRRNYTRQGQAIIISDESSE